MSGYHIVRAAMESLRPHHWGHFLTFPLAGCYLSTAPPPCHTASAVALSAGLLGFAFALNNFHDNGQQQSPWWHRLSLLLALPAGIAVPWTGLLAAGGFALIATLYSAPPRLKRLPVVGTLCNALGFPLLILVGAPGIEPAQLTLTLLATCWLASAQLIHEEAHLVQDRAQGVRSSAMVLGRGVRPLALGLLAGAVVVAWRLHPVVGLLMLAYAVAVALLALALSAVALRRAFRWLGLACAAASLLVLP